MPRLKTISLRTLLTAREKLPLRPDDRFEHLLERFRVVFDASRVGKDLFQLQRNNLVFWLFEGMLHSIEITVGHSPSDLVNWCGFDFSNDILNWCAEQGIELSPMQEADEGQLWMSLSGALIALQGGSLWNITLTIG
ncbi:hypothetical protein V3W47_10660 [Deinococcus sp. YIM 134068]|uniref:hypothetical protein n=1 Tax=Deinococcus lichenicola TaxID=3118910 RepID=UPI002F93BCD6